MGLIETYRQAKETSGSLGREMDVYTDLEKLSATLSVMNKENPSLAAAFLSAVTFTLSVGEEIYLRFREGPPIVRAYKEIEVSLNRRDQMLKNPRKYFEEKHKGK